jgi:hypothetical protein
MPLPTRAPTILSPDSTWDWKKCFIEKSAREIAGGSLIPLKHFAHARL